MKRSTIGLLFAVLLSALGAPPAAGVTVGGKATKQHLVEVFSPNGSITRIEVNTMSTSDLAATEEELDSRVGTLHYSGPSSNRFDLVIMGDGYTQSELNLFHDHARSKWETIATTEPFSSYLSFFNVWYVDVESAESGVDNDPRPPTMKDTALDMQFWCNGTERLLCVNQGKAQELAALAPGADQILVLANSTKYGGAGGGVATSSGGSAAAGQITVHELGHSIGHLADEYDYYYRAGLAEDSNEDVRIPAPYVLYTGGEPSAMNVTASDSAEMATNQIKWWRWLGEPSPDGTTVSTYEGGGYYKLGVYRPTENSLMKSLGQEFNLPSREEMTVAFYEFVTPIEAHSATDAALADDEVVYLDLVQPTGHALDVRWFLDGQEIGEAAGRDFFEVDDAVAGGHETLTVKVRDLTEFVRNPAYLDGPLSQELSWSI